MGNTHSIVQHAFPVYTLMPHGLRTSTYYVSTNEWPFPDYSCPPNTASCHIYCDEEGSTESYNDDANLYHCNNAMHCYFHCDQKSCARYATVNASNAHNLTITQAATGQTCLGAANIYAPNSGSAYISSVSKKGITGMNLFAGTHTKEIIVDTTDAMDDEKKDAYEYVDMNIHAETARYLRITIGDKLTWKTGAVECPVNSLYNGPDSAPCVIDATDATMTDIDIIAPDGTPKNVIIEGCDKCENVGVICEGNSDQYPFDSGGNCWYTLSPTTDPTIYPTNYPTNDPTNDPTFDPTINPTQSPTKSPTFHPTKSPTKNPSFYPSVSPTKQPTVTPTTRQPTSDTASPSAAPTSAPSTSPSIAPSDSPSEAPFVATNAPSETITSGVEEESYKDKIGVFEGIKSDTTLFTIISGTCAALLVACVGFFFGRFMFTRGNKDVQQLQHVHDEPVADTERVQSGSIVIDGDDEREGPQFVYNEEKDTKVAPPGTWQVAIGETPPPPPPLPVVTRPQAATAIHVISQNRPQIHHVPNPSLNIHRVPNPSLNIIQTRPQAATVPIASDVIPPPPPPPLPPQKQVIIRHNTVGGVRMMLPQRKTRGDGTYAVNRRLLEQIADRQSLPAENAWKMSPVVGNDEPLIVPEAIEEEQPKGQSAEGVKVAVVHKENESISESTRTLSEDLWDDGARKTTTGNINNEAGDKENINNKADEEDNGVKKSGTKEEKEKKEKKENKDAYLLDDAGNNNNTIVMHKETESTSDSTKTLTDDIWAGNINKKEEDIGAVVADDDDETNEKEEEQEDKDAHLLDDLLDDGTTVKTAGNNNNAIVMHKETESTSDSTKTLTDDIWVGNINKKEEEEEDTGDVVADDDDDDETNAKEEKQEDKDAHLLDDLLDDGTTVKTAGNNNDTIVAIEEEKKENDEEEKKENGADNNYLFDMAMGHMNVTPDGGGQSDKMQQRMEEVQRIKLWMENEVQLGEYTNVLIMNGYDDMQSVMDITEEELIEIGIQKLGHRRKILKFINKLKI